MNKQPESNFSFDLMALSILAGGLFCGMHLLNGWLLKQVEINHHISLIYLPGFLRLANVLVLGLLWGSIATTMGGIMLMLWTSESWGIALSNVAVSAGGAALAIVALQVLLQRRLSLGKLSDLLRLALLYAVLNALCHHVLWSLIDPSQLVDRQQVFYMVIGDVNGAVIGAFALRWMAQHTRIKRFARRQAFGSEAVDTHPR
ncbi:hypothetical protein [Limnohabitans sp.]|uniref:hypothetical protein n=1 Tax=Limnohabitans sp. TaxID=1907725 RepID=UPI0038B76E0F